MLVRLLRKFVTSSDVGRERTFNVIERERFNERCTASFVSLTLAVCKLTSLFLKSSKGIAIYAETLVINVVKVPEAMEKRFFLVFHSFRFFRA